MTVFTFNYEWSHQRAATSPVERQIEKANESNQKMRGVRKRGIYEDCTEY